MNNEGSIEISSHVLIVKVGDFIRRTTIALFVDEVYFILGEVDEEENNS